MCCAGFQAVDLLARMLRFDPNQRITIDEALEHPYLAALHSVDDEPEADSPFNFDYEKGETTKEGLTRHVLEEVRSSVTL